MKPLSLLLCFLMFTFASYAQIVEFSQFKDLPSHLSEDTLLVFDIDDTLLVPVQMLGNDEWFQYRCKQHEQAGLSRLNALEKALAEWEGIRHLTNMRLVEEDCAPLIQKLQQQQVPIIGLTTQGLALATRTVQQLNEHNIDLSLTAPCLKERYFQTEDHGILYKKGILFTSAKHKGKALMQLLKEMDFHPKKVIFVNDKATHLAQLGETVEECGIDFLGLRYNYSDGYKSEFCPEVAEYQFQNSSFHKILSDEEAKEQLAFEKGAMQP